ncbi:hypothetical protein HUU05_22175 [candidate division KSB1 bacterium]|nr:hypothetical protein [candidate division KSB1 bacterium]
MSEMTMTKSFGRTISVAPAPYFETDWGNRATVHLTPSEVWIIDDSNTFQAHNFFSEIKLILSGRAGIESVWIEDLGKEVNVLIITKDVRNATLDPIFDAKMAMLNHYPYVKFNFELNPVDFEKKLFYNQIQRIV